MARPHRTLRRIATTAVATVSLVGAMVAGTAGSASASTTIPTTCSGVMHRVAYGHLYEYVYRGMRIQGRDLGALTFGTGSHAPTTLTLAQQTDTTDVYFAVLDDGSLWRVDYDGATLSTTVVAARGWSGVRHITASPTGTRLYALTTNGGLYRYSISTAGQLRGLGAIATTGWGTTKFLSPSAPDATYDSMVGVSTAGAVRQYLVNRSSGATVGRVLVASGWSGMRHVSIGACAEPSPSAPIMGVTNANEVYGYLDRNAYDLNGSDIRGVGRLGRGFSGLMAD